MIWHTFIDTREKHRRKLCSNHHKPDCLSITTLKLSDLDADTITTQQGEDMNNTTQELIDFLASDYYQSNTRNIQDEVSRYLDADFYYEIDTLARDLINFYSTPGNTAHDYLEYLQERMIDDADLDYAVTELSNLLATNWGKEHLYRYQAHTGQISNEELTLSLLKL